MNYGSSPNQATEKNTSYFDKTTCIYQTTMAKHGESERALECDSSSLKLKPSTPLFRKDFLSLLKHFIIVIQKPRLREASSLSRIIKHCHQRQGQYLRKTDFQDFFKAVKQCTVCSMKNIPSVVRKFRFMSSISLLIHIYQGILQKAHKKHKICGSIVVGVHSCIAAIALFSLLLYLKITFCVCSMCLFCSKYSCMRMTFD